MFCLAQSYPDLSKSDLSLGAKTVYLPTVLHTATNELLLWYTATNELRKTKPVENRGFAFEPSVASAVFHPEQPGRSLPGGSTVQNFLET